MSYFRTINQSHLKPNSRLTWTLHPADGTALWAFCWSGWCIRCYRCSRCFSSWFPLLCIPPAGANNRFWSNFGLNVQKSVSSDRKSLKRTQKLVVSRHIFRIKASKFLECVQFSWFNERQIPNICQFSLQYMLVSGLPGKVIWLIKPLIQPRFIKGHWNLLFSLHLLLA